MLVARPGEDLRGAGCCTSGSGSGAACAVCIAKRLITCFTPCACCASFSADVTSASLFTVPLRVTTPLSALMLICRPLSDGSELILVWTSPATCASVRSPLATLADFEQPLTAANVSSDASVRTAPADLNLITLSFERMSPV